MTQKSHKRRGKTKSSRIYRNLYELKSRSSIEMSSYELLQKIIATKEVRPTIINTDSKFVVITYWWGRGVLNKNTARPCMEFYEKILTRPFEQLKRILDNTFLDTLTSSEKVEEWIKTNPELSEFYNKKSMYYVGERKDMFETYRNKIINFAATNFFEQMKLAKAIQVVQLKLRIQKIKFDKLANKNSNDTLLETIQNLTNEYTRLQASLKTGIRPTIANIEKELIFREPITYDQMIHNWEQKCIAANCNYMAIEYPEFAKQGGYQMAINAKPLFIQKALQSCDGRAVVYIDGDMTMNRYPHIFDMDDIDFMARGWHMDPRASWSYLTHITVDPYVFETSGGIMYFSNSLESHNLLQGWIQESGKPHQQGKADDRIISLIFNTKRLLAPMKIIQLPIEYLWLSMSYDEYVEHMDRDEIYVEHPECLTSEDTATSSGASSNRSAKFSGAISHPYPKSEMLYERAMFPTKEMADQFRPWLNYLNEAVYNEDDAGEFDPDLIGEQPFYIVPFDSGFGKLQSVYDTNMADISLPPLYPYNKGLRTVKPGDKLNPKERIVASPANINSIIVPEGHTLEFVNYKGSGAGANSIYNVVAIDDTVRINVIDIPTILKHLVNGKNVLYTPTDNKDDIDHIQQVINSAAGRRLEFIFTDKNMDLSDHMRFHYVINTAKPVFIRAGNPILIMAIALLTNTVEAFERVLAGKYQFISRIRIHVMKARRAMAGGGAREGVNDATDRNTDVALEFLYHIGGRRRHGHGRRQTVRRRHNRRRRNTRRRKN